MAVLQELDLTGSVSVNAADVERVKEELARRFWQWYAQNLEEVLVNKRILFWKVTLKVRNLYEVFVRLFGTPPIYVPEN